MDKRNRLPAYAERHTDKEEGDCIGTDPRDYSAVLLFFFPLSKYSRADDGSRTRVTSLGNTGPILSDLITRYIAHRYNPAAI
jgi:hypothetical protein